MINSDKVIAFNRIVCNSVSQESILINENNLLSAISVQQWFDKEDVRCSALFRSLIQGHLFEDGNKRTAVLILMSIKPPNCSDNSLCEITLRIAKDELKDPEEISKLLYF